MNQFRMNALVQTPWLPRPSDALMLANLLRSSRLTLLFGEAGAGKTGLLQHEVLPLLHQHQEMAVLFNASAADPLAALHEGIDQTLRVKPRIPRPSLTDRLTWLRDNKQVRLLILLDNFDRYLKAMPDDESTAVFVRELKEAMSSPESLAHFFMAVRDESQPLLAPWRAEVAGFGDRWIRIRHWHTLQPSPDSPDALDDDKTVLDPRFVRPNANVLVQFKSYAKTQANVLDELSDSDAPNPDSTLSNEVDIYLPLTPPPAQSTPESNRVQGLWDEVINRAPLSALQAISPRQAVQPESTQPQPKTQTEPSVINEDALPSLPQAAPPIPTKRGPWLDWLHRKRPG
jgi:RecA/RadA recombinase